MDQVREILSRVREYYGNFQYFRKEVAMKKAKTYFFKWINKFLNRHLRNIPGYNNTQFRKLPQVCMSNTSLAFT